MSTGFPFTAPSSGPGLPVIGLYLNKSKTGSASDPYAQWLGDTAKEDALLQWCQDHDVNYITMYGIDQLSSDSGQLTFDLIAGGTNGGVLGDFIYKARTQYGIVGIGVVGDLYRGSYDNLIVSETRDVARIYDYNENKLTVPNDVNRKIHALTQETESWWMKNAFASDLIDISSTFPNNTIRVGETCDGLGTSSADTSYFTIESGTDISFTGSLYDTRITAHNNWTSGSAPSPVISNNWSVAFYLGGVLKYIRQVVTSDYDSVAGKNIYRVDIPFIDNGVPVVQDNGYTMKIINTNESGYKTGIWRNTVSEEAYYRRCAAIKTLCETYGIYYELYLGWFEETTSSIYSTLANAAGAGPVKLIKDMNSAHFDTLMPHCYIPTTTNGGRPTFGQVASRSSLIAANLVAGGDEENIRPIISLEPSFSACWFEGRPGGCTIPQSIGCCPGVVPKSLRDGYDYLFIDKTASGGSSSYYNNSATIIREWFYPDGVMYFAQTHARALILDVGVPNSGACTAYPQPTGGALALKNYQQLTDIKINGVSDEDMVAANYIDYDETGECNAGGNVTIEVVFTNNSEATIVIDNVWEQGSPAPANIHCGVPCIDDPSGNITITGYTTGPIAYNQTYSVTLEIARPTGCVTDSEFRLFIYPWSPQYSLGVCIDVNIPGDYTFIDNQLTLSPTTTSFNIPQSGYQAQTIQVTNDSCVSHEYDIVDINCSDFTFTQLSIAGGGTTDLGGNPLRFSLDPGAVIDIEVSFTSATVGSGTCTYDIVSELGLDCEKRRTGRNNYTVTGNPVLCFDNQDMFICCDDVVATEDFGGTQTVACVTVGGDYYINVNPIFPDISGCAGTLTVTIVNDVTEVEEVNFSILAEDITYAARPFVQIPWKPSTYGNYTVTVLMENDCTDSQVCTVNINVCEEYSWSKTECHKYLFVVPTPVAGRINTITVESKTDEALPIETYTVNNDDIDRVEIPLDPDGVYIITITDNMSTIVQERVVYEFCDMIECLKKLILDILCDKYDPCCKDCNELTIAENNEKRYHITRVVSLYSVLAGYMFKEKVKYFEVFSIDEERMIGINEISNIMEIINEITKTCGEC